MLAGNVSNSDTSDDAYEDIPNEINDETEKRSLIKEIKEEILDKNDINFGNIKKSSSFSSQKEKNINESCEDDLNIITDDYLHDEKWRKKKKHIFVLSSAGKPIYSLHGNEDKLATIFGVMQALVSFIGANDDNIISINAEGAKFVFLNKNPLILVAVSRSNLSVQQLQMQLMDVYNQILSTLTYSHMSKIFDKRKNFDLRRLLAGSERVIDNLVSNDSSSKKVSNNVFSYLTNAIQIMPLSQNIRNNITSAIHMNCAKIKNLVFAILIANNKLIALVRMRKYSIHPADLRIIFNLIECSESFKTAESWTPICLPRFDANGFLHAHVSYLSEDCQACLLLLSVDRDVFFVLSEAKKKITEKLRRSHCLEVINEEMNKNLNINTIGIFEIRHFLYKCKINSQLLASEIKQPYKTINEFERLQSIYCDLQQRTHSNAYPLKLIYRVLDNEIVLSWITAQRELYAVFEPTVDKNHVIKLIDKLLRWIDKEQDVIFIKNHPIF